MKKSILPVLLVVAAIVLYFVFKPEKAVGPVTENNQEQTKEGDSEMTNNSELNFPGRLPDERIINKKATIETEKGVIELELFGDKAPLTVSNFVYLAEQKFYDGLIFHRVVPGFVIQGGDPNGNGTGGPGYKFEDEEVLGDYVKGSLAMANSGPDTNGSQFFICLEDQLSLPKQYNLFGKVISGLDVVSSIEIDDKINSIAIESLE
jgi:cyclophilin family peptidyl-prolyl cis-trans isomerase